MKVSFVFPSSHHRTAGVIVLYEFANGLARRGHEVHFVHGPWIPVRVNTLGELPAFPFDDRVQHHIVDRLDDPDLPETDVVSVTSAPARLGLPLAVVQGFRMFSPRLELATFRARAPKVCVARWLVEVGRSLGVPDEQLHHVPLGLDHDVFAYRRPPDARPIDVAMLYHEHVEKGGPVGLAAIAELATRRPGFRATVFGRTHPPGPLPEGVEFRLGPDQTTLVEAVYNRSRVFLQSSHHEGFGYTAVEAMACGAALVTTDNGGSRDYASDGETALVVPPGDPTALAAAAGALLDDDPRRTRIAAAGERFVRRFDWDRSAGLLEALLERYLDEPSRFQAPPAEPVDLEGVR